MADPNHRKPARGKGPGGRAQSGRKGSAGRGSTGTGRSGTGQPSRSSTGQPAGRGKAPVRRSATPRPADLPHKHEVTLPRGVRREIERTAPKPVAEDVVLAVSAATERAEEDPRQALPWLRWAREAAPRSVSVLEALAITAYLAEEYPEVVKAVRGYRRLTGREDQNHLLADALRAQGHPTAELAEVVEAMDDDVPGDRMAEGRIVWAAALGDAGDPRAGLVVLQAALDRLRREDPSEALVRVLYVAGDLAQQAGLVDRARELFREALDLAGEDPWDLQERLEQLG